MAETILLPQQGNSVESVILLQWNKQVGESVQPGEVLCEVETDKTTMEVEATAGGTVLKHLVAAGDEVAVKTAIAIVGESGEQVADEPVRDEAADSGPSDAAPDATAEAVGQPRSPAASAVTNGIAISPRARMKAEATGVSPDNVSGTGPGGRIIERDILNASVDADDGSGIGGRRTISERRQTPSGDQADDVAAASASSQPVTEIKVQGIRKVIAERMRSSLNTTAQFTLHGSADARALQNLRKRFKQEGDQLGLAGVNINDMVMFAAARTLQEFPELNAHFQDTMIRRFAQVDLSFAVDTDRGLVVPTIRKAGSLSLRALSESIRELSGRCIEGKATAEDLSPGTFTVSNLGMFGVEYFTPVINPPQVAILGINTIVPRPVYTADGTVDHIPHIGLSLTIDHQAVDGAPAARFLQKLSLRISQIDLLPAQ